MQKFATERLLAVFTDVRAIQMGKKYNELRFGSIKYLAVFELQRVGLLDSLLS